MESLKVQVLQEVVLCCFVNCYWHFER